MRLRLFNWLGRDMLALSGEGRVGLDGDAASHELLGRFGAALAAHGLSLQDTVRTRLFARDEPSRLAGSTARRAVLGNYRGGSASYVAPALFDSDGVVAFDLIAMRPSQPGATQTAVEYDPPQGPLRWVSYDGVAFFSGVAGDHGDLADQVRGSLGELTESLALAGTSWERVALISCYLRRDQDVRALRGLLRDAVPQASAPVECEQVDGFAPAAGLIEIEITAVI
jgi:enamine deaminase RidA (YjgF/YER057c/UK114 family)